MTATPTPDMQPADPGPTTHPEKRVPITVLVRPEARRWLDRLAAEHYPLRLSDVVRAAMVVARQHDKDLERTLKQMQEQ